MATLGCSILWAGLMICQPGDRIIETYVAGDLPHQLVETTAFIKDASANHQSVWGDLTTEKIDAAFADWGPRRHLPIDWSKVKGYKP